MPPQYHDPKYAHSGFPVMIALPGGPGFDANYRSGSDLKLEADISKWSKEGSSLPFIRAMPVLNPASVDRGGPELDLAFQVGTEGSGVQNRPPIEKFIKDYGKGPVKTKFHVDEGGGHDAYTYVPGMYDGGLIQWVGKLMRGPVPSP